VRSYCLALMLCSTYGFGQVPTPAASLTYSTYLRDNFTPTSIATDAAGNIYLAGSAVVDSGANQTIGLVVKLNPQANAYLYVRYFGGSAQDRINALAVDSTGNVYIAGYTTSPDFPVYGGGSFAAASTGPEGQRSFVAKLDPNGNPLFSDLLGGSSLSSAQAVAITAAGNILVSGDIVSGTFPSTPGAYSFNGSNHPFLLELNPAGTAIVFSAVGIGGSALALDSAGNIYMAGTTSSLDYPTTAGAYQPSFPIVNGCIGGPCMMVIQGTNQYVTKVDSTASHLIFSTALSGTGNTINGGLAIDLAGNVYVTGYAGAGYPYTVKTAALPAPVSGFPALPFLSKLDPTGAMLLFSVPAGGAGVQVDPNGAVYAAGATGTRIQNYYAVNPNLPALAGVPATCLPNGLTLSNSSYLVQADGSTGEVRAVQYLGGSSLVASSITFAGSTLWVAGATGGPGVPYIPGALPGRMSPSTGAGAYLGAVDFSKAQPAPTPQIACILDSADFSTAGPDGRYQLLTIFGNGIGPSTPVSAPDNSTTQLGGVRIAFTTPNDPSQPPVPAILLYASASQINFAVPLVEYNQSIAALQLTVNGVSAPVRALPLVPGNPRMFLNLSETQQAPPGLGSLILLALNPDGSVNSPSNPVQSGTQVTVFLNGMAPDPQVTNGPFELSAIAPWIISTVTPINPFVVQVKATVPVVSGGPLLPGFGCNTSLCVAGLPLFNDGEPISPTSGGQVYVAK
jgi:uncharacterized protein (TIGR03437 family)